MKIKGKIATAVSCAKEMEEGAAEQIRTMCGQVQYASGNLPLAARIDFANFGQLGGLGCGFRNNVGFHHRSDRKRRPNHKFLNISSSGLICSLRLNGQDIALSRR